MLTLGETGFGTGGIYSLVDNLDVTELIDYVLSYEYLVTYGAMLTLGETGFGTGGIYSLVGNFGVTECLDYFLSYEYLVTY